jgi:hypothetical protein
MPAEKILAALALAVCVAMLVRMALKPGRRAQCDRAALRLWRSLAQGAQALLQWPSRRRRARQAAQDAIRRAQGKAAGAAKGAARGRWKGNVYTPDAFGGQDDDGDPPPPRRDMH